ncbi:MAG: alpha/beta hydrolase [Victivallales bacterium]|nr:alpha/beta hydrolase [Victivallales bacterium]
MISLADYSSLQAAVDAAAPYERILIPAGEWECGSAKLKSNLTICFEPGATLIAPRSIDAYQKRPNWENLGLGFYFLGGIGLENVTIEGPGKIVCNGGSFWENYDNAPFPWDCACEVSHYLACRERPAELFFQDCENLVFKDFEIIDAAAYTVWTMGCSNVRIQNLTIRNNRRGPNTDALDIDCCSDVWITGCNINAGDDCIALKCDTTQLGHLAHCQRIHICDNTLSTPCCAVRVGYEGDGYIQDVVFNGNIIHDCHIGYDMISIVPPMYGKYRGIYSGCRIQNIVIGNSVLKNVYQPIKMWSGTDLPEDEPKYTGYIRNIRLCNLDIDGWGASFIGGINVSDITLSNVNMRIRRRPSEGVGQTPVARPNVWGRGYMDKPLVLDNVKGLVQENVSICSEVIDELGYEDFFRIEYKSKVDGLRDWAMYSHAGQGRPCVVILHGHGSMGNQIIERKKDMDAWRRKLVAADVSVLSPNLRGNAWMNDDAVEDLAELLKNGRKNMGWSKVIIASGSMGGTGALIFAVRHPELVDGIAAFGAATDIKRYVEWCAMQTLQVTRENIHDAVKEAYRSDAEYEANSVCGNAQALTMPVFYYHGGEDQIIPVSEARALNELLRGKPNFHYKEVPGGDHDSPLAYFGEVLDQLL